jgi:hypothetical protein
MAWLVSNPHLPVKANFLFAIMLTGLFRNLRPGNLEPTAKVFGEVYKAANKPAAVRGLVTNVSNFNGWNLTAPPLYAEKAVNYDESRYITALAPYLEKQGFPVHFITDTGMYISP